MEEKLNKATQEINDDELDQVSGGWKKETWWNPTYPHYDIEHNAADDEAFDRFAKTGMMVCPHCHKDVRLRNVDTNHHMCPNCNAFLVFTYE